MSGLSCFFSLISLVVRLASPTYVVAHPPTAIKDTWVVGEQEFLSLKQVASLENLKVKDIENLILANKIEPLPLKLHETSVTWAVDPHYKIIKY